MINGENNSIYEQNMQEQQNVQRVVNKTTTTKSPPTVTSAISTSVSILHQFHG